MSCMLDNVIAVTGFLPVFQCKMQRLTLKNWGEPGNETIIDVYAQVSLNLSNNRLKCLPEDISLLSGVQELFLQYNHLTRLPVHIFWLLIIFNVVVNNHCCLQASIRHLTSLVELDVKNNQLTHLPGKAFIPFTQLNCIRVWAQIYRIIVFPEKVGGVELDQQSAEESAC